VISRKAKVAPTAASTSCSATGDRDDLSSLLL